MTFQPDLELRVEVCKRIGFILTDYRDYSFSGGIAGPDVNGWFHWEYKKKWISLNFHPDEDHRIYLPSIETTWEVCAEYLVPFMMEKDQTYQVSNHYYEGMHFQWGALDMNGYGPITMAEIINDNIALAACKSFLEVDL